MINPFNGNTWVAYFDIMGFKHFMDEEKGLNVLNKYLDDAFHILEPNQTTNNPQKIDGIFFSDSGVIFYSENLPSEDISNLLHGLNEILKSIQELNTKFITPSVNWGNFSFLTKSAVAFGEFIYEKKDEHIHISKGPVYDRGYVKACQSVEKDQPHKMEIGEVRIVLDDSLRNIIEREKQNTIYPELKYLYQISDTHCYYSWTHHFQPNSDLNRARLDCKDRVTQFTFQERQKMYDKQMDFY